MGHALIVEDDADSARMMAALVTTEGYSAATAQSYSRSGSLAERYVEMSA